MTPQNPDSASPEKATREALLDTISQAIVAKREEAVKGRANSGIEQIWAGDEEFYEGYDDANRHEFKPQNSSKPTEGGRSTQPLPRKGSTLFPNICAPYVDMSAAKISDMLMGSADWRAFEVKSTPIPKRLFQDDEPQLDQPQAAQLPPPQAPAVPPSQPGMASAQTIPQPGNPAAAIMADPAAAAQGVDPLKALMAKAVKAKAESDQAAQKAEDAIDDALIECQFTDEMRKVIHDAARIGTGVLKGPVPEKHKTRAAQQDKVTQEYSLVIVEEMKPVSKRVDARNCYPDFPACGEDIHAGNFFLEFAPCTEKQLRALKGGQGPAAYLDEQIDRCIEEGPSKSKVEASGLPVPETNYPRWYFYGVLKASEAQIAGVDVQDKASDEQIPIIATLVNDHVVKIAINPMEANEFPYDFLVWKSRSGMPWGLGVTRQARTGQRIATAGLRNLMDNAGASARPHKVMADGVTQDGDPWTWKANSDASDVRGAMQFFIQPSLQTELENIISLGRQQIELETGLPMTVLGMQGSVQETAKGRTILDNNGSTVLRRIARNFDVATESHVRRYYQWLLLYSEDDAVKGDMQIQARGSSSLVERDLQSQQLPLVMNMANDPAMQISKIKARDELLKSMHFDPKTFEMDDEEKAKVAATPPPKDPRVAVAELHESEETKRTQLEQAEETKRTQMETTAKTQVAGAERVLEAHEGELDRQLQLVLAQVKERIEAIKDQGATEQSINEIKGMLAATTIKVQAQRDLSPHGKGPQVLSPPDEPAGRAPNGHAFAE
jgi:hypothetical protein